VDTTTSGPHARPNAPPAPQPRIMPKINAGTYMHSILWCCTSCGFVLEGGQPHMECPICEAYKDAFIDSPAHLEAEIREKFGDDLSNSAEARRTRLAVMRERGYIKRFRVKGRTTEVVHAGVTSRKLF